MRIRVKLPERYEAKRSLDEYLSDSVNGEFNRACYEALRMFYKEKKGYVQTDDIFLHYFNEAYKVAIRFQRPLVEGDLIMGSRVVDNERIYQVTSTISIEKEYDAPHFAMPITYHLLKNHLPAIPLHIITPVLTRIREGFMYCDKDFFFFLQAELSPSENRELLTRILNRLLESKTPDGKLAFCQKNLWRPVVNILADENLFPSCLNSNIKRVEFIKELGLTYQDFKHQEINIDATKIRIYGDSAKTVYIKNVLRTIIRAEIDRVD